MLGILLTGDWGVNNVVEITVRESEVYRRLLITFEILFAVVCNQISSHSTPGSYEEEIMDFTAHLRK